MQDFIFILFYFIYCIYFIFIRTPYSVHSVRTNTLYVLEYIGLISIQITIDFQIPSSDMTDIL